MLNLYKSFLPKFGLDRMCNCSIVKANRSMLMKSTFIDFWSDRNFLLLPLRITWAANVHPSPRISTSATSLCILHLWTLLLHFGIGASANLIPRCLYFLVSNLRLVRISNVVQMQSNKLNQTQFLLLCKVNKQGSKLRTCFPLFLFSLFLAIFSVIRAKISSKLYQMM